MDSPPSESSPHCKKPGAAFWTTMVLIAALVVYPVSFAPAVWATVHWELSTAVVERAYWPILCMIAHGPEFVARPLKRWGNVGARGAFVVFPVDRSPQGYVTFGHW